MMTMMFGFAPESVEQPRRRARPARICRETKDFMPAAYGPASRAPEDILIHPDFQKESDGSFTNDIALIRLPKPAKENLAVRVACLPINPTVAANDLKVPDIQEGLSSTVATVVGWGFTSTDPTTRLSGNREKVGFSIQQKLAVPVLSRAECRRRNVEPKTQQICAGGEVGKGFCTVST